MFASSFSHLPCTQLPLGEILVRKGFLNPTQLTHILEVQQQDMVNCRTHRLGELLIEQGIISNRALESALQEQFWRQNGFWVID
jgi:hypothetical protein